MKYVYLNLEEILRLHFQLIEDFGGFHGVRDEGRLISVVEAPKLEAFRNEQYTSIFDKASVYLSNIIGDHPFIDGNKRTAITVCGIFLHRNHKEFKASQIDLENLVLRVATEHLKIDEISDWLRNNTK